MKLNHLNLTVTDVPAAGSFLEKYFGLRRMGGNAGMAFYSDDDGFVLRVVDEFYRLDHRSDGALNNIRRAIDKAPPRHNS